MTLSVPDAQNIPPEVLAHYHQHYHNSTYRAFSDELHAACAVTHGEGFLHAALNLLIDASLGRCGAAFYAGAEDSLMKLLTPISPNLLLLAQDHLAHFGPTPELAIPTLEDSLREQIRAVQHLTEETARAAGDLATWRGRVAYKLVSASAYLLHTAEALLVDSHYDGYPLEKLDRALSELHDGVLEAHAHNFKINPDFVAWMRQRVRARD